LCVFGPLHLDNLRVGSSQYNNHEVNGKRVVIILDLEILGYTEDRIVIEAAIKCAFSYQ
jgi:hypothetical protein